LISYTLTARTADGYYKVHYVNGHFGTTYLDENGGVVDPTELQGVSVGDSPVQSSLVQFPGSNFCTLTINLRNPFETPLLTRTRQAIPLGTVVVEGEGAVVGTNELIWDADLLPEENRLLKLTLQLPTPLNDPLLPATGFSAYDALNSTWVEFELAPTVMRLTEAPASNLEPSGITVEGFQLGLRTFIPGVYRIEATRDFSIWEPISTRTNAQGLLMIQDSASLTNAKRFYRALRLP
jgi:hypothetical protein